MATLYLKTISQSAVQAGSEIDMSIMVIGSCPCGSLVIVFL